MAIKLEGRGGKALMAWPLVEEFFFAASLNSSDFPFFTYLFASKNLFYYYVI